MAETSVILETKGLRKSFGPIPAVVNVSLELGQGELVAIVGPSGSGKTTLLRLLAGLDEPDAGHISLNGKDMNGVPPRGRDVAVVFQGLSLYPHKTVHGNIGYPLRIRGVSKKERDARVLEMGKLLGIESLLARFPRELSGGEAQRAALAKAIVREPVLYLLDEPLSSIDAALRAELRIEIVRALRFVEATGIIITHDQEDAVSMGDRVAVMNQGVIEQIDHPREVYKKPANAFVARFLGNPGMNLIMARVGGRLLYPLEQPKAPLIELDPSVRQTIDAETVLLGLRANELRRARAGDAFQATGAVEMIENSIRRRLVHMRISGARVIMEEGPSDYDAPQPGENLEVSASASALYLFRSVELQERLWPR